MTNIENGRWGKVASLVPKSGAIIWGGGLQGGWGQVVWQDSGLNRLAWGTQKMIQYCYKCLLLRLACPTQCRFLAIKAVPQVPTCTVLWADTLLEALVPLVGLKVDGGVVLWQAVGYLAFARPTYLEANPPVTEKTGERASVSLRVW